MLSTHATLSTLADLSRFGQASRSYQPEVPSAHKQISDPPGKIAVPTYRKNIDMEGEPPIERTIFYLSKCTLNPLVLLSFSLLEEQPVA